MAHRNTVRTQRVIVTCQTAAMKTTAGTTEASTYDVFLHLTKKLSVRLSYSCSNGQVRYLKQTKTNPIVKVNLLFQCVYVAADDELCYQLMNINYKGNDQPKKCLGPT